MIPTKDCYGLPLIQRQCGGFEGDYRSLAAVEEFQGIYYYESGYLKPGYMNAMPYDHPLDRQGHIASALHSGVAAYSSYIRLIALGIFFSQKKETGHRFEELHYFGVVRTMPHPDAHGIWGSLHFLPLVSNVFLSCYDSGTFLSHITAGEYGFDIIGSPCIDIYQMYMVVPMIRCGIPYVGVRLIYQSPSLFIGTNEDFTIFLKAFFARCESSVDIAQSQALLLQKMRGVTLLHCVINPEEAQSRAICSSQTLTFWMMVATRHAFHGIQERANVFIPLEFRHPRDMKPRWRTASF